MITARKLKTFVFFVGLLFLSSVARAWIWQEVPEKTMTVRYRQSVAANTSTAAVVIQLSDTVNWPHKQTGQINISSFRIEFDKAAASTATAKLGIVNFVNTATGSVTWFYGKENNLNVSNTGNVDPIVFQPNFVQGRVQPASTADTNGTTTFLLSNDTTSGSTMYQSDVRLPAPITAGAYPKVGDVVLFVQTGSATVVVQIEIQYHTLN